MIEQHPKEENLHIIKEIGSNPVATQRTLSEKLGFSLGKTNYLLKELVKKGLIKARDFSNNPKKLKTVNYILTKKGLEERISLTYHFLRRKEEEFYHLKREWDALSSAKVNEEKENNG